MTETEPGVRSSRPTRAAHPGELLRDVLWRRADGTGLDHCRLWRSADTWVVEGTVLTTQDGGPYEVHYRVETAADWTTRTASVRAVQGPVTRLLEVRRDESGRWFRDHGSLPEFDGLADVDLSISPCTNILPIRRLALDIRRSAATDAVWIRFPGLALERLEQRYTRTAERHYRYESGDGVFVADLEVDEVGLNVRYGDIWERAAPVG